MVRLLQENLEAAEVMCMLFKNTMSISSLRITSLDFSVLRIWHNSSAFGIHYKAEQIFDFSYWYRHAKHAAPDMVCFDLSKTDKTMGLIIM